MAQTQMAGRIHVVNWGRSDHMALTWCGRQANKRGRRLAPSAFSWEHPEICRTCARRAEEAQIRDTREAERRRRRQERMLGT